MAELIYGLCTLTALVCTLALWRSYFHNRHRLLFWSGACFAGLTLHNFFLVLDKVVFTSVDLLPLRLLTALAAQLLLLYGLIFTEE